MELPDFFGDVWGLDINSHGTGLIGVSADMSIRVYEITQEQIIPDWQKEKKYWNHNSYTSNTGSFFFFYGLVKVS